jgi:hypothetical protein
LRLTLPKALVVDEEECSLWDQWTAKIDAKLVQRERRQIADRSEGA